MNDRERERLKIAQKEKNPPLSNIKVDKLVKTSSVNFLSLLVVLVSCNTLQHEAKRPTQQNESLSFAWPFQSAEVTHFRGGTTRGLPVTLAKGRDPLWQNLQTKGLSAFEKDRRAILAMTGSFRVSFQFIETVGFDENGYVPPRPYFSWATEHVQVLADRGAMISLQHILVMNMAREDGKIQGPMVMKHWRQDWTYQDQELHTYLGLDTWQKKTLSRKEAEGQWTQAVFQVDDSPRYEVTGHWQHQGLLSLWQSDISTRPLPLREYSVREDYNVLAGDHRITIYKNGWLHEQRNRKISKKQLKDEGHCLALETGLNRYERITAPSLDAAQDYWKKTSAYWALVREEWLRIFHEKNRFQLKKQVDKKKLYELHFAQAQEIATSGTFDENKSRKDIHQTIAQYLMP